MSRVRDEISSKLHPFADRIVTAISGCPARHHVQRSWPPALLVCVSFVWLAAAAACLYAASLSIAVFWRVAAFVGGSIAFTGAVRYMQTVLMHYAAHNALFRSKPANLRYSSIVSAVFVLPSPEDYHREHVREHHRTLQVFATREDPDAAFLLGLGFAPGTPLAKQRRLFLRTLFNPFFHLTMIRSRVVSAAGRSGLAAVVVVLVLAGLAGVVVLNPVFGLALLFSLFPLAACAALLQFLSEHLWFAPLLDGERAQDRLVRLSHARFCCDPPASSASGWAVWWLRLFCVHLPMRVMVLNGDLPQHDMHHLHPTKDFQTFGAQRRALNEGGVATREYWGYGSAMKAVMQHIEGAAQ